MSAKPLGMELSAETELGRRIAALRAARGWTQQNLAERTAMSRVAVSHLEAGLSQPSERSVALLAGVFQLEAHDLVAGSTYPMAKAERLPLVVARYTEVELQLRLLDADLKWCVEAPFDIRNRVVAAWNDRLVQLLRVTYDRDEQTLLRKRQRDLH